MKQGYIGVDEAGRGAWAGPVVAACVFWSGRCPIRGILQDSKQMSPSEREQTYDTILELAKKKKLFFAVGIILNEIIDTVGIREANRLAMLHALQEIQKTEYKIQNDGIRLMIDGRDNYQFDIPDLPKPEYVIRGDSKIKQIMAASIIAKVTRDRMMREYDLAFSGYGFAQHKGYGTPGHQKALQKLGICKIHRKSYKPIRELSQK
ncbi:MAG: ribonuclease HII [Candidatus Gracilibacteria bacterium]